MALCSQIISFFYLVKNDLLFYLFKRKSYRERRRDTNRNLESSIWWFTPQMAVMARAAPPLIKAETRGQAAESFQLSFSRWFIWQQPGCKGCRLPSRRLSLLCHDSGSTFIYLFTQGKHSLGLFSISRRYLFCLFSYLCWSRMIPE